MLYPKELLLCVLCLHLLNALRGDKSAERQRDDADNLPSRIDAVLDGADGDAVASGSTTVTAPSALNILFSTGETCKHHFKAKTPCAVCFVFPLVQSRKQEFSVSSLRCRIRVFFFFYWYKKKRKKQFFDGKWADQFEGLQVRYAAFAGFECDPTKEKKAIFSLRSTKSKRFSFLLKKELVEYEFAIPAK